jgi:hypothetical protein
MIDVLLWAVYRFSISIGWVELQVAAFLLISLTRKLF